VTIPEVLRTAANPKICSPIVALIVVDVVNVGSFWSVGNQTMNKNEGPARNEPNGGVSATVSIDVSPLQ